MEKKEWAIVLGVVLVVAIVAGAVSAGVTGNSIRVKDWTTFGSYKVYTKGEIDKMIGGIATNQGVLDMFGEGRMVEVENPESTRDCVSTCHQNGMQCAFGEIFVYADDLFAGYPPEWMSHNLACEDSINSMQFYETFSSSEKLLRCLCLPLPN